MKGSGVPLLVSVKILSWAGFCLLLVLVLGKQAEQLRIYLVGFQDKQDYTDGGGGEGQRKGVRSRKEALGHS